MIKNMDMEYTHIQMADHTKVNGLTESSMVKAYLSLLWVHKEKEYGMKAKESDGLTIMITIIMKKASELLHFFFT